MTADADGSGVEYQLDGLVRIDPDDGTTVATIDDLGTELVLAATDDALWIAGERVGGQGWVWRIGPDTGIVTIVQPGDGVRGDLAVGSNVLVTAGERLWAAGDREAMPCRPPPHAAGHRSGNQRGPPDVALPDELPLSAATAIDGRVWFAGLALGREGRAPSSPRAYSSRPSPPARWVDRLARGPDLAQITRIHLPRVSRFLIDRVAPHGGPRTSASRMS